MVHAPFWKKPLYMLYYLKRMLLFSKICTIILCLLACLLTLKQNLPQTDVYVAWNRATKGITFARNVFMTFGCGSDYVSFLILCSWRRYLRDQWCQSVCQRCIRITHSNVSYLPDTPGEQDMHPFRFFYPPVFLYYRKCDKSQDALEWCFPRRFIQHSSPER